MSRARTLVRFGRAGGRPPADDEGVTIRSDGTFEAHRTLGGRRVGRFAGTLPAPTLAALERDLAGLEDADPFTVDTPRDGATETVEVGRRRSRLGSNERPPKAWSRLVERLREILRDVVVEHPVAVLELEPGGAGARIVHRGTEPLEVDLAAGSLRVTGFAADDAILGSRSAALGGRAGTWLQAGPGWSAEVSTGAPVPGAVRTQLLVHLRIRDGTAIRDARLIAMSDQAGEAAVPGS